MNPVPSDAELIEASKGGQLEAFGLLVERYQNLVCAVAFSATRDRALSEDVGQETFVAAWTSLPTIQEPAKLKGWLCGTARNLSKMALRKRRREMVESDDAPERVSNDTSALDELVDRERATAVYNALEGIAEPYRETLVLFYREDKSIAQVADGLGISEDAVKQRLSRGRQTLRQQVADLLEQTLASTKPRKAFTAGVLAMIGARAAGSAAAANVAPAKAAPTASKSIALAGLIGLIIVALALYGRGGDHGASSASHRASMSGVTATTSTGLRSGPRGAPPTGAPPVPIATLDEIDRGLDPKNPRVIIEVIDVLGGPIEDADVFENDQLAGRTNANGLLAISRQPTQVSGVQGFRVRASGYADERVAYSGYGRVTIAMVPESTISGTVVAAVSNTPVAGIRVFARGLEPVTTDTAGRFVLERVPPEHYELMAGGPGWSSKRATTVDVGLHMNQTDVVIPVDRGFSLEGRVIATAGDLPTNLELTGGPAVTPVERNGRFRLEVPPGTYKLALKGYDTAYPNAEVTVTDHDVKGIELALGSLTSVEVIATYSDGAPVAGVDFMGELHHEHNITTFNCTTDDHGHCRMSGMVAGELKQLRPRLPGVASRDLVVPTNAPVRFEVPTLGSITGTVMNAAGRPVPWRIVICNPDDKTSTETVISDAKGRFQVGGLPPGTYALEVFAYDNRSFPSYITDFDKHAIGSTIATVAAGQLVTDVRIATTFVDGQIAGVVTASDGQPLPGALVTYAPENQNLQYSGSFVEGLVVATDDRGRFAFTQLDASRPYQLRAQGPNGEQGQQRQVRTGAAELTVTVKSP